jgi:16S rRNA pseudouridine516 synthase
MSAAAPQKMRLDRLLANLGYGSRREMQMLARNGRIKLDGAPLRDIEQRMALDEALRQGLQIDGEGLDPLPGFALMMHKPLGVTCSHKEAGPLVFRLLPDRWRRRDPPISTVGRLDKETSGLLLMTDDGGLLHKIISPRRSIAKVYRATLDRDLRGDEADIFAAGSLMLEGEDKPLLPAGMEALGPREARLVLSEGRYHQARRMFAAVGNHVLALHREAIGGLTLPPHLAPGEFRVLTAPDIEAVFTPPGA